MCVCSGTGWVVAIKANWPCQESSLVLFRGTNLGNNIILSSNFAIQLTSQDERGMKWDEACVRGRFKEI